MAYRRRDFGTILTLLVIVIFAWLAYHGFIFYEDGEDSYLNIVSTGMLTGGPQTMPDPFGVWVGLTHIITYLFQWKINFDWYASFETIAYGLLIYQLGCLAPVLYNYLNKAAGKYLAIIILASCTILFSENLFFWAFTRISLLLSGLSLLRIWLCISPETNFASIPKRLLAFNLFCFTYAALIRSEPAALNLAVWMPLIVLGKLNGVPLKNYLVFLLPAVIITAIAMSLNIAFNETDREYLAYRKYQFSLLDFRQSEGSVKFQSAKDSMLFAASRKSFSCDRKQMNPAFFDRIGILPLDKTVSAIPYYFKNLSSAPEKIKLGWTKLMAANPGLAILYCIFLLAGSLSVFYHAPIKLGWYLLAQFFLLFLCLAVTSFMKMENRVLVPLLWCYIIQNLVWCFNLIKDSPKTLKPGNMALALGLLVILPVFFLDAGKVYGRWRAKKREYSDSVKMVAEINSAPQKIIVINISGIWKFNMCPFEPIMVLQGKKPVSFDNFIISFLPKYGPYMKSIFGSSDLEDIARYLVNNKNDVLIVSSPGRMELIKPYLEVIYGIPFNYEAVDTNLRHRKNDVILYRLI